MADPAQRITRDALARLADLPWWAPFSNVSFTLASDGDDAILSSGASSLQLPGLIAPDWNWSNEERLRETIATHWTTLAADGSIDVRGFRELPEGMSSLIRTSECAEDALWKGLARLLECAMLVAEEQGRSDPRSRLRIPLFARLRFVFLSAPFRYQAVDGPATEVFDHGSGAAELSFRARRARDAWAQILLEYEAYPIVALEAEGKWLEDEARTLVFEDGMAARRRRTLLNLHETAPGGARDDTRARFIFVDRFAREFFLRRLMVVETWEACTVTRLRASRVARWLLVFALLLVGASPALDSFRVLPTFRELPDALGLLYVAVGAYVLFMCVLLYVILRVGPLMGYPFCLRLIGSSFLGVFGLATLGDAWRSASTLWLTSIPLLLASLSYLCIQARAHGAAAWSSVRRAVLVLAVGWTHAVGVTSVALAFGFPGFYDQTLRQLSASDLGRTVTLGAAISLSLGVFLQMLWEDSPVTFPLGRLPWRSRA